VHICLGASLACCSQRSLWPELPQDLEWAELAGGPAQIYSAFVAGLKKLSIN